MFDTKELIQTTPETDAVDFQQMVETLPEGLLIHWKEFILYANSKAAHIFGVEDPQQLIGNSLHAYFQPEVWRWVQQSALSMTPDETGKVSAEMILLRVDDKKTILETTTSRTTFKQKHAFCTLLRDISQRKQGEKLIRHQANYDTLTGLPNRTLFLDRLKHEIIRARRQKKRMALMFIDLDRFKWVNDTLGHAAGDKLLKEVARRLKVCLRESDTIARLGGDEFTAILPDMAKGPFAERVAGQILTQLAKPFILNRQEALISGSLGITVFPDDSTELNELIGNADTAMYRAKADGRNTYRFFTPDMHAEAQERMALEKDLHHALKRNELAIHYQPIVNLNTGTILGAESFLRWIHPTRGNISPNTFIPLAEEIGMISHITEWTIGSVCAKAVEWREKLNSSSFFISVNLSCTRCRELSTDEIIPRILHDTGLPPSGLILEITENILSEDEGRAMTMLNHLTKLGVNLWLDDFGTGHSSLSVLKRLPVSGIKIDRAFVPDVLSDPETAVLVEAIISLAKSLNRQVIGEGVEEKTQSEFLRNQGCTMGQGYLFSKAVPAHQFAPMLEKTFPV